MRIPLRTAAWIERRREIPYHKGRISGTVLLRVMSRTSTTIMVSPKRIHDWRGTFSATADRGTVQAGVLQQCPVRADAASSHEGLHGPWSRRARLSMGAPLEAVEHTGGSRRLASVPGMHTPHLGRRCVTRRGVLDGLPWSRSSRGGSAASALTRGRPTATDWIPTRNPIPRIAAPPPKG